MKKTLRTRLSLILLSVLFAAMTLCLTGCGDKTDAAATETQETAADSNELGEGAMEFAFDVTDKDGNVTSFTIHTDAATVGEALVNLGLVSGDESEWGLYVKTVNGITADYDVDGTYWAFYINGEYASTGVDATEVEDGATYAFKVE